MSFDPQIIRYWKDNLKSGEWLATGKHAEGLLAYIEDLERKVARLEKLTLDSNADLRAEIERLRRAIREHAEAKADDRCWLDDAKLYELVGIEHDARVGDREGFLANCARFFDQRCKDGGWATYEEMETALRELVHVLGRHPETVEFFDAVYRRAQDVLKKGGGPDEHRREAPRPGTEGGGEPD